MADELDQVLADIQAQHGEDEQRRVPAPKPRKVPPVTSGQPSGGRAAPNAPPRGSGPSFMSSLLSGAARIVDKLSPALGAAAHLVSKPDVTTGIGAGILRSPVTAAAGVADFVGDVAGKVSPRLDPRNYEGRISPAGVAFRYSPTHDTLSGFARHINPLSRVGNNTANEISTQVASLAVGYGAGAKLAQFAGAAPKIEQVVQAFSNPLARSAASLGVRAAGMSAVDAIIMDPEVERFSNVLQHLGVKSEFTDWLAHKDNEGRLEGRLKNGIEGLGLGAATEGLMSTARYWRARLRGDHAEADAIQAELAAKHDGEVPDIILEEHPGELASTDEASGYVGGWEHGEDGSVRPVYAEDPLQGASKDTIAEAADDGVKPASASMASEKDPSVSALPEGMGSTGASVPPIDPKAIKAAMKDTGAGAAEDPIVSFTARATPDGEPLPVGSIDRASLEALGNDVRFWRATRDAEGERAIDVTPGTETAAEHGEFRLGNIGAQDHVAPLLRAMVDRIPEQATRSDAELMADAARAAKEMGTDPAALLEAARLISGKLSDADTAMVVLRTVWKRAADDLDVLPDINWETATQDQVDQAAQRIYNMMSISSHVQDAKAGLGRGLRVNQLPDADSYLNTVKRSREGGPPIGDAESGPLPRTRQEIKDWFELWQSTKGEPELRDALLEGALTRIIPSAGKYLRSSFANFFTASILSAPRTLLLNLVGPAAMSVIRNTERLSGAAMMAVNPLASAEERQAAQAVARATVPAYLQTLGDISDTMRWALKASERNKSMIGGGGSIDSQASFGPWTESLLEAANSDISLAEKQAYSLGNAINMWPRAVQSVNAGFDEFSKRLAYLGEVRVRALTEGIQEGLQGDELKALVKQRLQGATNEAGHALDEGSLREAERTTLTYQTGEEGGHLRAAYQWMQALRKDVPETRYILPILNVPANTLGESLRRLPIAAIPGVNRVLFKRTADELAGVYGPVLQADAHGRMLTGATFLLGGVLLNRMGLITGSGPQNPTDRKVWLMEHQPYSIRIGDQWVRYDKYDVIGGLLSIPSTIVDATSNVPEDQTTGEMFLSGAGALAQWFKDRAAVRGAAGLLALGDDPTKSAGTVASRTFGSILGGMVPNALQATVTQVVDPYVRMKNAWTDYLKAAIPGLSTTLPPVRNVLGEPVNRPANSVGEGMFPVLIAPAVTFKDDPVIDELDRVYQATGYGAGADPKSLGYGFFNPKDVVLENGQNLFDAFMQARLEMRVEGRTLRESLATLFQSDEYNSGVDADSGAKLTSRGDVSRGYLVKAVFETYNKQIKAELASASPIANNWLTAAAAKQRDDAYLKDVTAEDLVANPDYYRTHGIDPTAYSSNLREGSTGALLDALRRR